MMQLRHSIEEMSNEPGAVLDSGCCSLCTRNAEDSVAVECDYNVRRKKPHLCPMETAIPLSTIPSIAFITPGTSGAAVMSRTAGSKLEVHHLSLSTRFSAPYTTSKDLSPSVAGKR